MQRCPDITLAGQLLDWKPTVALEQGLGKTIQYFDTLLAGPPGTVDDGLMMNELT